MGLVKKLFEDLKFTIGICAMALSALVWAYSIFATKDALAEKEQNLKTYVDQKHTAVENRLDGIKEVLDRVDQRVYELNKRTR